MWNEQDQMLELIPEIAQGAMQYPVACPVCHQKHAHMLMHRFDSDSPRGSLWVWCDACKSFAHVAYAVPDWWQNPDFIDDNLLDSSVEYPAQLEDHIDAWNNKLCSYEKKSQ